MAKNTQAQAEAPAAEAQAEVTVQAPETLTAEQEKLAMLADRAAEARNYAEYLARQVWYAEPRDVTDNTLNIWADGHLRTMLDTIVRDCGVGGGVGRKALDALTIYQHITRDGGLLAQWAAVRNEYTLTAEPARQAIGLATLTSLATQCQIACDSLAARMPTSVQARPLASKTLKGYAAVLRAMRKLPLMLTPEGYEKQAAEARAAELKRLRKALDAQAGTQRAIDASAPASQPALEAGK